MPPESPAILPQPEEAPFAGLPQPRRRWSAMAILLSIGLTVLDGAMLNVALPGIAADLGLAPAAATWILSAYQLTVVTTLLPMAALGESLGFRRVQRTGLVVFILGALGASLATGLAGLVACRVLQGLGAAAVMSLTAGFIRHTYSTQELGRAIGNNAMVVAAASAAGPSLAAAILAVADWPWLFLATVPVALAAFACGWRNLPSPPGTGRPLDLASAALNVLTFGLLFLGLGRLFAAPGVAVVLLGGGIVAGTLLVQRQLAQPAPLLPVDLLAIRPVAFSVGASVCAFAAWYASYVALPFLLHGYGLGQAATGLLMTPWPLAIGVTAPVAGRLADRLPSALLCAGGMAVMALGLGLLAILPIRPALTALVVFVCGAGFGLFQTPNNRTMLAAAPLQRAGGAGGMQATARLLGTTLGTTTLGLAFAGAGAEGGAEVGLIAAMAFALCAAALSLSRR